LELVDDEGKMFRLLSLEGGHGISISTELMAVKMDDALYLLRFYPSLYY
jgi:hypothetical protein